MAQLAAHEFLHVQEHIRSEIACAEICKQVVDKVQDPELRQIVENQIQTSEQLAQQLNGFLTQ